MEYIGASTKTPELSTNYFGSHPKLKQDIKTMDKSIIKKVIICETDDIEYLAKCEKTVIKKMKAVEDPKFYNANAKSGFPNYGKTFTEEHRKKLSENHACWSGENNPNYGKKLSDETKAKISKAHKGKKKPPLSEEHKAKISKARKGKPSNRKGVTLSDEIKAKLSIATKAYWARRAQS